MIVRLVGVGTSALLQQTNYQFLIFNFQFLIFLRSKTPPPFFLRIHRPTGEFEKVPSGIQPTIQHPYSQSFRLKTPLFKVFSPFSRFIVTIHYQNHPHFVYKYLSPDQPEKE
jgi:hypothetical protein